MIKAKLLRSETVVSKHILDNFAQTDGTPFANDNIDTVKRQVFDPTKMPKEKDRQILEVIEKAVKDIDKILKIK